MRDVRRIHSAQNAGADECDRRERRAQDPLQQRQKIETVAGRVLFNQFVPEEVGFVDELLTKKKLQQIISRVFKVTGMARTAQFLDDIKTLGFQSAYKGGLSMGLGDIVIHKEKDIMEAQANKE